MEIVICPACKHNIQIQKYRLHLFKAHNVLPIDLHYFLQIHKVELKDLSGENIESIRQTRLAGRMIGTITPTIDAHKATTPNTLRVLYILWDDIVFGDGFIRISSTRISDFLHPIKLNGVFKELNQIKNEYFLRIHGKELYSFKFDGPRLLKLESPGWERFRSQIKLGKQYFKLDLPDLTIKTTEISKNTFSNHYRSQLSKNKYLKLLAVNHHLDFPLLLIEEGIGHHQEQSILFRTYDTHQNILVFWENINEGRATHVFFLRDNYEARLKVIQSFISSPNPVKRLRLHLDNTECNKLKRKLSYHSAIHHHHIKDYKRSLLAIIKSE